MHVHSKKLVANKNNSPSAVGDKRGRASCEVVVVVVIV
jgi:hypothetical protein